MKDNDKCFILTSNGYEGITYAELSLRRETDPLYIEKRFIPLHGMLMEVSLDDYKEFYKNVERQKYLRKEAIRANEVSYNALDSEDMSGEDVLVDMSKPVDEYVSDKLRLEEMLRCFGQLSKDDRALLHALFFDGKSERELARELEISQPAVHKRLQKVLVKLRSLMNF